jgi:hypothetical protein
MSPDRQEQGQSVLDDALESTSDNAISDYPKEKLVLTAEEERQIKRRIDWKIIPYFSLLYLLSESHALRVVYHGLRRKYV